MATMSLWQAEEHAFPRTGKIDDQLRFLLRYAVMAPSIHNTQPWKFAVRDREVRVLADQTRWLKVADPDQRELYISLGCALENLLVAAAHFGLSVAVDYFPESGNDVWVATVRVISENQPETLIERERFHAIMLRRTNRMAYARQALPSRDLDQLQSAVTDPGVTLRLSQEPLIKQELNSLIVNATVAQFADPGYRDELLQLVNQPSFNHSWLVDRMGQLAMAYLNMDKDLATSDANALINAPSVALLSSYSNNRLAEVRVGQGFERIALVAATMGIAIQPLSQVLQVSEVKAEINRLFPAGGTYPQFIFRLGYAEGSAQAPGRDAIDSVLI